MTQPNTTGSLTPDQAAAHEFLAELRTRISTQPLPYQYGVEARALESLRQVFDQARDAIKKHPGCKQFTNDVTQMLNNDLRPVTAKWHRAYSEGRLNSRDGADQFRIDLQYVQEKLRRFAGQLHQMAYGEPIPADAFLKPMPESELAKCFADIPFGIVDGLLIPDEMTARINGAEADAIRRRRSALGVDGADGRNAVGLALSGGGIRSATFCLGATQVLAARDLLKDVDFLSTVSGGGYVGCFLTTRLQQQELISRRRKSIWTGLRGRPLSAPAREISHGNQSLGTLVDGDLDRRRHAAQLDGAAVPDRDHSTDCNSTGVQMARFSVHGLFSSSLR